MNHEVKQLNFQGKKVYIGLDVHLQNWRASIAMDEITYKTISIDPCADILYNYLDRNFPKGEYYSAYEAGFCGFSVHRALQEKGINNIVVNPADIPTTDKERKQKEDKRDSRKIARSLRNGELKGIFIPKKQTEELRGLIRYRQNIVKEIARNKTRIKSFLN